MPSREFALMRSVAPPAPPAPPPLPLLLALDDAVLLHERLGRALPYPGDLCTAAIAGVTRK